MPTDEELEALVAQLEPGVQLVISLLRRSNQQLTESGQELNKTLVGLRQELKALRVQNDELKRMLFGPKSEKMPSMGIYPF